MPVWNDARDGDKLDRLLRDALRELAEQINPGNAMFIILVRSHYRRSRRIAYCALVIWFAFASGMLLWLVFR